MYVYTWRPEVSSAVFPSCYLFERGSLTTLQLMDWPGWVSSKPLRVSCLDLLSIRNLDTSGSTQLFI